MLRRTNWVQARPLGATGSHQFRANLFQRAKGSDCKAIATLHFSFEIKHLTVPGKGKP
jgi:hypothetical protein